MKKTLISRTGDPVKCIDTRNQLFRWKVGRSIQKAAFDPVQSSTSSPTLSTLRAESSPSPSRSRSPQGRRLSRSPPRTPRQRAPRVQSLSPLRDTLPPGSPRDSRRDTPTRNTRFGQGRFQHVCRNDGCGETFRSFRERNDHETSLQPRLVPRHSG